MNVSVRLCVRLSFCHAFFTMFPLSCEIFQELLPIAEVMSMQKVRGPRSRSQVKIQSSSFEPQPQYEFT